MALELRQQMKLSQQLIMTQQLQQAIKLLQLSRIELIDTISSELMENPFLEESYDTAIEQEFNEVRADASASEPDNVYDTEVSSSADWEDYLGELSSTSKVSSHKEYESFEDDVSFESRYAAKPTLASHLLWQLRFSPLTEEQMEIGEVIIGSLENTGYLKSSLEEIAELTKTGTNEVATVLHTIQNFDPVGVASKDLQETLLVQIKNLNYDRDPILLELITNHLPDLENNRYKALAKKFKIDDETLFEYIQIIQSLDPMPGSEYGETENFYISPDAYVYKMNDDFVIVLNEDDMPHLQVSESYSTDMLDSLGQEEKGFFMEKQKAASWLIKAIHQRQRTLYKVLESILKYQRAFFEHGLTQLKPLILKTVADDISMHESTISRITTNKYLATPHGMYEIKFFFNSALSLGDGTEVGSESVKAAIKKYISEENPKSPLSDDRLCELLKNELGVQMARRTVAKYRTALNIPSSAKRKVQF